MVELVDKAGKQVRKGRINPALRTAIALIVEEGTSQADAARRVGMKAPSLTIALKKPHVRAYKSDVMRAWLESKTERAWLTVANLAETGASEDVQLKAARFLIEQDQEARKAMPNEARQLVQIINHGTVNTGQLPSQQLSGVIEAQPYQPLAVIPSNSRPVGRAESEDDDGEA